MIRHLFFLIGIAFIASFTSCKLEKARPAKKQYLIIASDCLESKDAKLFTNLKKSEGIKVRIVHLSADSLKKKLIKEGANCEIDAILLSSVYSMKDLSDKNLLQKIPEEELPKSLPSKYLSKTKNWAGIGIDPYVLITVDDSLHKIKQYSNLTTKYKWQSTLSSDAEWYPFYAPIVQKNNSKNKNNAYRWIYDFSENNLGTLSKQDTNSQCNTLLTSFSKFQTSDLIKKSKFKDGKLLFPNQRIGGSYYNMHCYALVKQARNCTNALKFFNYLLIENVNKRVNATWKTFPVISINESIYDYQNLRFKKYYLSPVHLTAYFERVKNILETLR